jgi:hypothetical protein
MKKFLGIAMAVLASIGCATVSQPVKSVKAAEYPGVTYDTAFEAVKVVYADLDAGIEWADKDTGYITAKARVNDASTARTAETAYTNYDATFQRSPGWIHIRMKIYTAFDDGTYRSEGSREMYDEFWSRLDKALGF